MASLKRIFLLVGLAGAVVLNSSALGQGQDMLRAAFDAPPQSAKPWVYWYFMDGHITREGLTADLEAMKKAGIGGAIFLTVNLGVPKPPHPVEFMSPEWQDLYGYMIKEADRCGIAISLGVGPGWSGDGGPWIKAEDAMQHLVASVTPVTGGRAVDIMLPRPIQREPYFGRATLSKWMLDTWMWFYKDECVLAYPTPTGKAVVPYVDEKALYFRAPYSSSPHTRPYFDAPADPAAVPVDACLDRTKAIDLTGKLDADGRLKWDAPPGEWTVYRFGRTLQGQNTRPSPSAGLGFESDKFNSAALASHAKAFLTPLIERAGKPSGPDRGLTTLHLDSWEMGSQNWTGAFREQFKRRRGYDPLPYLPAMLGQYVTDSATTERFLWDLRQTARELVHDEHLV
ncbi:MAG: glycosyl hydrolase, partial [Tepidisphaeraceae bacterium]